MVVQVSAIQDTLSEQLENALVLRGKWLVCLSKERPETFNVVGALGRTSSVKLSLQP